MELTLKNTAMIEEAHLAFDGLTVITGENDSGKSTVGKLLFSIIKSFNRHEQGESSFRLKKFRDLTEKHRSRFNKEIANDSASEFIDAFFHTFDEKAISCLKGSSSPEDFNVDLRESLSGFASVMKITFGVEIPALTISEEIENSFHQTPDTEIIIRDLFLSYLHSSFNGQLPRADHDSGDCFITAREGNETVFEIVMSDECVIKRSGNPYFEDATFIESPVILNLSDAIRFSKTAPDMLEGGRKQIELLERSIVPEYMRDLILKMTNTIATPKADSYGIEEIIGGHFFYDREKSDFSFKKGNTDFSSLSTAGGIKYLGIIKVLLENGFINSRQLLILDEPETNMHPQWQIRFAELIIDLVKDGISLLITTHSPYFIEALKSFGDSKLEKERVRFYLSERYETKESAIITDVTHNISPIFDLLARPYRTLESIRMQNMP